MKKKINIGFIGWGNISRKIFDILKNSENFNIVSVASNFRKKETFFNETRNYPTSFYNDYNKLLNNKEVKLLYIANTNNLHKELIIQSALKKKNVICEKPACLTRNDFEECISIIKKQNVFFCEALMYLHHPQIKKLFELLDKKLIGKIEKIECNLGFKVGKKFFFFELKKIDYNSRLFNKSLGGGAINDIGCYTVSLVVTILNYLFPNINLSNSIYKKIIGKSGVDESASAQFIINNQTKVLLNVSIRKKLRNNLKIIGQFGYIELSDPLGIKNECKITINTPHKTFIEIINLNKKSIYEIQFDNIYDSISNNLKELSFPLPSKNHTLEYLKILTDWKR